MVVKIFGAIFIAIASYLFGNIKINELNLRLKILERFKNDIVVFESEIEFAKTPIIDIATKIKENKNELTKFYTEFLNYYYAENDIDLSWENAVDLLDLSKQEKNLLKRFSLCFSSMDIEGQIVKLKSFCNEIDVVISGLREHINKNTKLYKNLGLYCGALLVVILL